MDERWPAAHTSPTRLVPQRSLELAPARHPELSVPRPAPEPPTAVRARSAVQTPAGVRVARQPCPRSAVVGTDPHGIAGAVAWFPCTVVPLLRAAGTSLGKWSSNPDFREAKGDLGREQSLPHKPAGQAAADASSRACRCHAASCVYIFYSKTYRLLKANFPAFLYLDTFLQSFSV